MHPRLVSGYRAVLATLAATAFWFNGSVAVHAVTEPDPNAGAVGTTAHGHGDDSAAVAVNTRNGSAVYALRLKVVHTGADVVDASNAAVAVASCNDCQTIAISLEGVLVWGSPEVVVPTNIAIALNDGCSGCRTLAAAYQEVVGTGEMVRLTGQGRREIADLRHDLHGIRQDALDVVAASAEADRIAAAFADVLRTQTVPIGPSGL